MKSWKNSAFPTFSIVRGITLARPKKTVRTVFKNIGIPEDLAKAVEAELYSEIEGKVPFGAQQAFYTKLLREHFENGKPEDGLAALDELGG